MHERETGPICSHRHRDESRRKGCICKQMPERVSSCAMHGLFFHLATESARIIGIKLHKIPVRSGIYEKEK